MFNGNLKKTAKMDDALFYSAIVDNALQLYLIAPSSWWSEKKDSFISFSIGKLDQTVALIDLRHDHEELSHCVVSLRDLFHQLRIRDGTEQFGWLPPRNLPLSIHFFYVDENDNEKFQEVIMKGESTLSGYQNSAKITLLFHYASSDKAMRNWIRERGDQSVLQANEEPDVLRDILFACGEIVPTDKKGNLKHDVKKFPINDSLYEIPDESTILLNQKHFCEVTKLPKEYYPFYKSDFLNSKQQK